MATVATDNGENSVADVSQEYIVRQSSHGSDVSNNVIHVNSQVKGIGESSQESIAIDGNAQGETIIVAFV